MDERVGVITSEYGSLPNILCASGTLEDALQLGGKDRYYPLTSERREEKFVIANSSLLYHRSDLEYYCIAEFFSRKNSSPFTHTFSYNHLLNLPNTPQDVRFRQEGVKELVRNDELFNYLGALLCAQNIYTWEQTSFSGENARNVIFNPTSDNIQKYLEQLATIKQYAPNSEPMGRVVSWAENLQSDTFFRELFKKRRAVTDSRLFQVYTERYAGVRIGVLKPGVKPEDVFDFIAPSASRYTRVISSGKKERRVERSIIGYSSTGEIDDDSLTHFPVAHARQRMDVLNDISSNMLAVPLLLANLQLKHLYQGAVLARECKANGFPVTFPEITDDPKQLDVDKIFPIRLVLKQLGHYEKPVLATNSFSLQQNDLVIQAMGPNSSGKSEALRTLHLYSALLNAGYPVPASHATSGVVSVSHFISCKGSHGYGGSEYARSLANVENRLHAVHPGQTVMLDEFGDATNNPTALESAKRLLPALVERGCRVFITTHHDALNEYIRSAFDGALFVPDPDGVGVGKFVLVRGETTDFKSSLTLDKLGFTASKIDDILSRKPRSCIERKDPQERPPASFGGDDDTPF